MRLERVFTHRVIRLLQVTVPVLVVVLVTISVWNYYGRRVQRGGSSKVATKLPRGVSVRSDGFSYSRTEGGRTKFTVHAKQSLGYEDDKYILQDVDVLVYGATERDPTRNIRGKNCAFDQATNDFTCNGNIEVQLDEKTIVRTEMLIYNDHEGIVTAPQPATLEQNGTVGRANRFEYAMNTGLLKLIGNVNIQTPDHAEIQTGTALFQQKENWTTMSGDVSFKSKNGWIRGTTGRADLEPGTYKPKMINVEGNVTAESQSSTANESWKLRAAWLEAILSQDGTAERVKTRGNVDIEKMGGEKYQRISGAEIDTTLKDGKVDTLEARQNARMVLGSDQTLESSEIWTNATGSVRTTDSSILRVGDSTIEGKDFVIENGENVFTFNTVRRATLKKEGGQESSSNQTRARFDSHSNTLQELVQTGDFYFRTSQYEGRAQTGRFDEGGTVITLEGSPVVNDSEKQLQAAQIRVNQKDNSFVATKNVSTLMKNPNQRVLVKAARAEGGADSMFYTGSVQLWREDTYIKAERLKATGQGEQNLTVHAEAAPGGKVESHIQNIRATSDTLDYDDSSGVMRYLGHVEAKKQDMILETPDLTANFRDGNVTEIVASGGVVVTRVDQRGTGERAVYDAATDVVTLTGKNAQVRDKEHGLVQGSTLVMKNKGHTVSVTGGNGERTVTRHPVKNDKR
jgi:LPS export ABC transporter protein LptC/lipopolysaccharide transport protein LptA